MRFSIASASAVVIAAVSLAAAAAAPPSCDLVKFLECLRATNDRNGGQQLTECGYDFAKQHPFKLSDPATVTCLNALTAFYGDADVPSQCNDCLRKPVPV